MSESVSDMPPRGPSVRVRKCHLCVLGHTDFFTIFFKMVEYKYKYSVSGIINCSSL